MDKYDYSKVFTDENGKEYYKRIPRKYERPVLSINRYLKLLEKSGKIFLNLDFNKYSRNDMTNGIFSIKDLVILCMHRKYHFHYKTLKHVERGVESNDFNSMSVVFMDGQVKIVGNIDVEKSKTVKKLLTAADSCYN